MPLGIFTGEMGQTSCLIGKRWLSFTMPEGLLDNEPYAGAHGAVEEFQ